MIIQFGIVLGSLMCPAPFIKAHTLEKWNNRDYKTYVQFHDRCQKSGGCLSKFERIEINNYLIMCGKEEWLKSESEKNSLLWILHPPKYLNLPRT